MKQKLAVFIKFGAVGGINTSIDLVVYSILAGLHVHYLFAQCISYICGLLNSYFMNRKWTFKRVNKANWKEFGRFAAINIITLLLTIFTLQFLFKQQSWSLFSSKITATFLGVCINFIGTKLFVFTTATNKDKNTRKKV
ncbi:MAG: GtrA family protein [Bacillus sp. (in: firmicutes)]